MLVMKPKATVVQWLPQVNDVENNMAKIGRKGTGVAEANASFGTYGDAKEGER